MKKILTILFCLLGMMASAEEIKMALLQPRVAEGSEACLPIELNMVRGELRKAFGWQSDFQVLTRTDVDAMLREHGFQSSGMVDDEQRKQVGIMTGAQYICVSTITKYQSQLYIEAYLVNIETGQMTNPATQFAKIVGGDYSTLQTPCNELAREMLGELTTTPRRTAPTGTVPVSRQVPEGYVDLGLPSRTLWKTENEEGGFVSYNQAVYFYGNSLPTKEQWEELKDYCIWTWTGNGYLVKSRNGESITLPAAGWRLCDDTVGGIGSEGCYWSSTVMNEKFSWFLHFTSDKVTLLGLSPCAGRSIRLVR